MERDWKIRGCKWLKDGGPDRDRTGDLIVANDALSQLSYRPTRALILAVARAASLQERTTAFVTC